MNFLGLVILYAVFFYFLPSVRSRISAGIYFLILYLFLGGIEGFAQASKNSNAIFSFWAAYIFIIIVHVPLLLKLINLDHHKHFTKHAREIFGKDLDHMPDDKLRSHLGH